MEITLVKKKITEFKLCRYPRNQFDTKTSNLCFQFKHVIILVITQVLQDRIDGISKTVQDLEGKNQSLQLTVDRLSLSLAKSEEEESSQKVRCTP